MARIDMLDAKRNKKNEFYTQYEDIQNELNHYEDKFENKTVFCNCDDPFESNFFRFFVKNFNYLKLKRLICTCYKGSPVAFTLFDFIKDEKEEPLKVSNGYVIDIKEVPMQNGRGVSDDDINQLLLSKKRGVKKLKGDGDFRSEECIEYLKQSDIVVTNPPFSLFREYVAQLMQYDKKFIIIGHQNAITYKEIFKLIKENRIWIGYRFNRRVNGENMTFRVPDDYPLSGTEVKIGKDNKKYISVAGTGWFTNVDIQKRHEDIVLFKKYNEVEYPKYDNYDAINVDKTQDIPKDYKGIIGVPITFMDKYNPDQFDIIALGIVGSCDFTCEKKMEILKDGKPTGKFTINAKGTLYKKYDKNDKKPPAFKDLKTGELYQSIYARILIKNKKV